LPDFAASAAAVCLLVGFATGLAGRFFSALRAAASGADVGWREPDGFDFAEIFLGLAAALAMAGIDPVE
jgi:hypothetical protein